MVQYEPGYKTMITEKRLEKWQAIFFDFDGVILNSVHVKTEAFAQMFRPFGPIIEQSVVTYHLENGGISRFEKFKHFYNNLLHISISEIQLQKLGEEFSKRVLTKVLEAPFITGSLETLTTLRYEDIPTFVVSGTPDEEIKGIVEKRGLSSFFEEVHGSPRRKDEILRDILGRKRYQADQCLFVGDAMCDYRAAQAVRTKFLGIVSEGTTSPFPIGTRLSSTVRFATVVEVQE